MKVLRVLLILNVLMVFALAIKPFFRGGDLSSYSVVPEDYRMFFPPNASVFPKRPPHNLIREFEVRNKSIIIEPRRPVGVVLDNDHYYLCSEDGYLLFSIGNKEYLKAYPIFVEVFLNGTKFSQKSLEVLERIRPLLEEPIVSVVFFESKRLVLLKGITIDLASWRDAVENVRVLREKFPELKPGTRYLLTSEGVLVEMK